MLNFGNKEFRNLQEQVQKNKDDIAIFRNGIIISYSVSEVTDLAPLLTEANVGKFVYVSTPKKLYVLTHRANGGLLAESLGDFPVGEQGEQGEQGTTGPQGEQGFGIIGFGTQLPGTGVGRIGDFFIHAVQDDLGTGYNYFLMRRQSLGSWVNLCSLRGPQGVQGEDGDEVEANPTASATDEITKIRIDGVVYTVANVLTSEQKQFIIDLMESIEIEDDNSISFGHDIYVDGAIESGTDITVGRKLYVDDASKIQDPNGNQIVFPKIKAPATLDEDTIKLICSGCQMIGTFNNDYIDPLFLPAEESSTGVFDGKGFVLFKYYDSIAGVNKAKISTYEASTYDLTVTIDNCYISIDQSDSSMDLLNVGKINGYSWVKKITAPTSTTLTATEKANIISGAFVVGTFDGMTNPVFFPAYKYSDTWYGFFTSAHTDYQQSMFGWYQINDTTGAFASEYMFQKSRTGGFTILNLVEINRQGWVKLMDAPSSLDISEDEMNQIVKGAFINGTFADFYNPVIFPAIDHGNFYQGMIMGAQSNQNKLAPYYIYKSNRHFEVYGNAYPQIDLQAINRINGKNIPAYPTNTGTFALKMVNGTLTWFAE